MRVHLSFSARDLDASVAFYRTLLCEEPSKHYAEYALFITERPRLELALNLATETSIREAGAHYGVVVETQQEVDDAAARFRQAGYPVDVRTAQECCFAIQNKVWATDPDGRRWETYYVVGESDEPDAACVPPACC